MPLLAMLLLLASPALADEPDATSSDEDAQESGETDDRRDDTDRPPPPDDGRDRPLAVPGPDSAPPPRPETRQTPQADQRLPGPPAPRITPQAPRREPEAVDPLPPRPLGHLDAGYRLLWFGNDFIPTRPSADSTPARPHLMHAAGGAMFDDNLYVGGSFEAVLNPAPGTLPFVAEVRVGWWDNAFGRPQERGLFGGRDGRQIKTLPGTAITYVGWRWVHDHYRGQGGAWAGTASAGGLVLGYTRSAPFGALTVTTDSQFSLYLLGWKDRAGFPLGLLNQRLSVGWDPIFVDARFEADPATGNELSIGVSIQSLF